MPPTAPALGWESIQKRINAMSAIYSTSRAGKQRNIKECGVNRLFQKRANRGINRYTSVSLIPRPAFPQGGVFFGHASQPMGRWGAFGSH